MKNLPLGMNFNTFSLNGHGRLRLLLKRPKALNFSFSVYNYILYHF
jgi:hypothetical protein